MEKLEHVMADEIKSANLLDCYRIAVDFGMPAALRAYEKLALEPTDKDLDTMNTIKVFLPN